MLPAALAGAAALLWAGCGGGADVGPAGVRDSADVRIVTSSGEVSPAERTTPSPALEVGAQDEPGPVFYRVASVVPLRDGRLVVANAGTKELWWLSASGQVVRKVGGDGAGPGEFRFLAWARLLPGDTVAAYDSWQRRLTRFTPRGDLIGTSDPLLPGFGPPPGAALAVLPPGVMGLRGDGSLLVSGWIPMAAEGSRGVRTVRFSPLLVDGDGGVDSLPEVRAMDWLEVPGSQRPGTVAFTPRLKWAMGVGQIYLTEGRGYRIDVFDESGRLTRSIREARPRRAVTASDREAWADGRPGGDEHVFPDSFPSYDALVVDSEGRVWARDFPAPTDTVHRWTTFDADGFRSRVVELPSDFTLEAVRDGRAYGVAVDSLDVERIRVYDLTGA